MRPLLSGDGISPNNLTMPRDLRVAHGVQHLGGQQGARPAGTVDHDVCIGLGQVCRCLEF
jgi:hypothetical protein